MIIHNQLKILDLVSQSISLVYIITAGRNYQ